MRILFLRKRLLYLLPVASLVLSLLSTPVLADTEQSINGSITPLQPIISITIDDNTLPYGVIPLGTVDATPNPDKVINITNNGNTTARLNIRGSDAIPTVNGQESWQLVTTAPGQSTYNHKFQVAGVSNAEPTTVDLTFIPRSPTVTEFANNVAPDSNGVVALIFRISTPTSTVGFDQRNFSVVIQAVAQ